MYSFRRNHGRGDPRMRLLARGGLCGEAHVEGRLIRHVIRGRTAALHRRPSATSAADGGAKLVLATDTVDNRRVELHWERG